MTFIYYIFIRYYLLNFRFREFVPFQCFKNGIHLVTKTQQNETLLLQNEIFISLIFSNIKTLIEHQGKKGDFVIDLAEFPASEFKGLEWYLANCSAFLFKHSMVIHLLKGLKIEMI